MRTAQHITIFLASPSDVQAERDAAREVLEELNRVTARQKNIHFDIVGWETDAYPGFGGDGQHVLNEEIGDMTQYDLFVGIMWNKFGSPTPRAGSGTEEEFQRAFATYSTTGKPDIAFYFKNQPANLASEAELAQKMEVVKFKKSLFPEGLIGDFADTNDFRAQFRRHMEQRLATYNVQTPSPPSITKSTADLANSSPSVTVPPSSRPVGSSSPHAPDLRQKHLSAERVAGVSESGMWVFLNNRYFLAERVNETEDGSLVIETVSTGSQDDVMFTSLRSQSPHRSEPIPYAHRNDGGLARVVTVTSNTSSAGKVWSLTLKPEEMKSNFFVGEATINGVSPDQIAEMRVRLLLLNELPDGYSGRAKLNPRDLHDRMLISSVRGDSGRMKIPGSLFPQLWEQFKSQEQTFLPLARLWAIFGLKTNGTVEHILELTLGPLTGNMLHVRFRGQRHKMYDNKSPVIIDVEGDCDLTSKPPLEDAP